MSTLTIDKAVSLAQSMAANGNVTTAMELYKKILDNFPDHKEANKGFVELRELSKVSLSSLPSETIQRLVNLYERNEKQEFVNQADLTTKQFPNSFMAWNFLGAANIGLGNAETAVSNLKRACELNPLHQGSFNSLGVALNMLGKSGEAIKAYDKAISLNPGHFEAYNNKAIALSHKGELEQALTAYEQAISLKPDFIQARINLGVLLKRKARFTDALKAFESALVTYPNSLPALNNKGTVLMDMGHFEEAEVALNKALEIKPDYFDTTIKLSHLLALKGDLSGAYNLVKKAAKSPSDSVEKHMPMINLQYNASSFDGYDDRYQKAQKELALLANNLMEINLKNDEELIKSFSQGEIILSKYGINGQTADSQIFTGRVGSLDCNRHKLAFDNFNIIPRFCFGCYKVQLSTDTVINLLKILISFWKLKFPNENTAKCMIEQRPDVKGTYKGFVFCNSIDEAEKVVATLPDAASIFSKKIAIKRGCSEFANAYPSYSEINFSGEQPFKYDASWQAYEDFIHQQYRSREDLTPDCYDELRAHLTIKDILIFRNWLEYAKTKNDYSFDTP